MPKALTPASGSQKKNKRLKKDPSNRLNFGPTHSRGRSWGMTHARRARSVPAPTEHVEILRGASTDPARDASEHPKG